MYVLPDCAENLKATPMPTPEINVSTLLTCSSTGGTPLPSYYWLKGTTVVSGNATVNVSEPGPFLLTCVANSSFNGSYCVSTLDVSGTAVDPIVGLSKQLSFNLILTEYCR